jgi:SpoVK/Ycf46/Vps4 family AAA+-type ATPase
LQEQRIPEMGDRDEEKPTTKKDLLGIEDKIVRQLKIISEDLMQKIELVAEGLTSVNENLRRTEATLTERMDHLEEDLSAMIRVSYLDLTKRVDDLDRRVKELEKGITH